jgi:tyrosinase
MRTDRRRCVAMLALAALGAAGLVVAGPGSMAEAFTVIATSAPTGPVVLKPEPVTVTLTPAPGATVTLATLPPGRKLSLTGTGLRTNVQPEVIYEVYLGLPSGVVPTRDSLHFVGTFNFFNVIAGDQANRAAGPLFTYDVTDLVQALRARKLLGDAVTVTVVPAARPDEAARPVVGEITLALE